MPFSGGLLMTLFHEENFSGEKMLQLLCDEQWSNAACSGYLILACEKEGYTRVQTKKLLKYMEDAFSQKTIEQAKKKYYDF